MKLVVNHLVTIDEDFGGSLIRLAEIDIETDEYKKKNTYSGYSRMIPNSNGKGLGAKET